jgi:hypothetical protein
MWCRRRPKVQVSFFVIFGQESVLALEERCSHVQKRKGMVCTTPLAKDVLPSQSMSNIPSYSRQIFTSKADTFRYRMLEVLAHQFRLIIPVGHVELVYNKCD